MTTAVAVLREIRSAGPTSASTLAITLHEATTSVEDVLADFDLVFQPIEGMPPRWSVKSPEQFSDGLGLRRCLHGWQVDALHDWFVRDRVALVSAVMGAGKTEVGLTAIRDARLRGLPTLVVVPTDAMVVDWHTALTEAFPGVPVDTAGMLGASVPDARLLIATPGRLHRSSLKTTIGSRGLMIVDEAQRFAPTEISTLTGLADLFAERLGLTSSLDWAAATGTTSVPAVFGSEIVGCTYERAISEGVLAPIKVLTVGVEFEAAERAAYDTATEDLATAGRQLSDEHERGADLCKIARDYLRASEPGPNAIFARAYMKADTERRRVLADSAAKSAALQTLLEGRTGTARVLVFAEDDDSARDVAGLARRLGVRANSIVQNYPSGAVTGQFIDGSAPVLATARLLADGAEVPTADIGIVLTAAHNADQTMQRMGRLIRPPREEAPSAVVVVYVKGTIEDPRRAADWEVFMDVAESDAELSPSDAAARLWQDAGTAVVTPIGRDAAADDGAILADTEDWTVRDAVLDVCAEYRGFPTWNELRDVLPDLEAEEALRAGLPELTWMRVGDALVGAGGRSAWPLDERIKALDILAQTFSRLGTHEVGIFDVTGRFEDSDLLCELETPRIKSIWKAAGGRILVKPTSATVGGATSTVTGGGSVTTHTASGPTAREVDTDPAREAFRLAVAARRGKVKEDGESEVVRVVGRDGVQRTAVVTAFGVKAKSPSGTGVRVLVALGDKAPEFYLFAHSRDGLDQVDGEIDSAYLAAARNDWRKLDLTLRAAPSGSGVGGRGVPLVVQVAAPTTGAARSRPKAKAAQSEPAGLRVVLNHDGAGAGDRRIVGYYDSASGEVELAKTTGIGHLSGKTYRNAAVAAATVKSKLAGRTVFSAGHSDWVVDDGSAVDLETYVGQRG